MARNYIISNPSSNDQMGIVSSFLEKNIPEAVIDKTAKSRKLFIEELYKNCWAELCGRLRKIYGAGPPEPEDIAQAAFAKIAMLQNVDHIENPRAYLFATAVNVGLTAIKKVVKTRAFIDAEMRRVGNYVEENDPERVFQVREELNIVKQAIMKLSVRQREILLRSRLKGETNAHISEKIGLSQATISRELKKALVALNKAVAERTLGADSPERKVVK